MRMSLRIHVEWNSRKRDFTLDSPETLTNSFRIGGWREVNWSSKPRRFDAPLLAWLPTPPNWHYISPHYFTHHVFYPATSSALYPARRIRCIYCRMMGWRLSEWHPVDGDCYFMVACIGSPGLYGRYGWVVNIQRVLFWNWVKVSPFFNLNFSFSNQANNFKFAWKLWAA